MSQSQIPEKIRALIADFHAQRIDVCYWKPSAGLPQALTNASKDIDLLVSKTNAPILVRHGFKRFRCEDRFDLPGVSNWVGLFGDYLCHIHLHESIYTGSSNPFPYRIPWSDELLESAIAGESGVPTLPPAADAAMMLARFGYESKITQAVVRDAIESATIDATVELLERWCGKSIPKRMISNLERQSVRRFFDKVHVAHMSPTTSERIDQRRHLKGVARKAYGMVKPELSPELRPIFRGLRRIDRGMLVSIVGADGAGKSTLAKRVQSWLATWFDAQSIYLGHGDWVTDSWHALARLKWKVKGGVSERAQSDAMETSSGSVKADAIESYRKTSGARGIVRSAARVAMADRKRRDGRWIQRRVRAGGIVITDRLPLNDTMFGGVFPYDGLSRSRVILGEFESHVHDRIDIRPDIVFKLFVTPEVAIQRKPDHDLEEVTQKANAFEALVIDAGETIEIDTTVLTEDEVFAFVIQEIWQRL